MAFTCPGPRCPWAVGRRRGVTAPLTCAASPRPYQNSKTIFFIRLCGPLGTVTTARIAVPCMCTRWQERLACNGPALGIPYPSLSPCSLILLHTAESFQRSYQVFSYSRNSPHFMEPEGLLPQSQVPATCPYPEPARSSPQSPHRTSWRSILILSSHLRLGLPSGLVPSGFSIKNLYKTLLSPIHATCPTRLVLLDFITLSP
jgi:hypothetical protein